MDNHIICSNYINNLAINVREMNKRTKTIHQNGVMHLYSATTDIDVKKKRIKCALYLPIQNFIQVNL